MAFRMRSFLLSCKAFCSMSDKQYIQSQVLLAHPQMFCHVLSPNSEGKKCFVYWRNKCFWESKIHQCTGLLWLLKKCPNGMGYFNTQCQGLCCNLKGCLASCKVERARQSKTPHLTSWGGDTKNAGEGGDRLGMRSQAVLHAAETHLLSFHQLKKPKNPSVD